MRQNKEILEEFGKILVHNVFDFNYKLLKDILLHFNDKNEIFEKTDFICSETFQSALFNFLKIFEENEQFKIVYEENGIQVNLVEISEMLKAEPIIENGWIARFSKELDKDKT